MTKVASYGSPFLALRKVLFSTAGGAETIGVRLVVAVTDGDWFDHPPCDARVTLPENQ